MVRNVAKVVLEIIFAAMLKIMGLLQELGKMKAMFIHQVRLLGN